MGPAGDPARELTRVHVRAHPEVAQALAEGRPVVALESTLVAHGLPAPRNLAVAAQLEATCRAAGAVPATIAVLDGVAHVGLDAEALERVATTPMRKLGVRDLAPAAAVAADGATTVASTALLADRAGIRVFATGGLGGVHRGWQHSLDESGDLATLAGTPVTVVCAGVKSILDVPATVERLETLNVGVLGYRTDRFPGFYRRDAGQPVEWRVDDAATVARAMAARDALGLRSALLLLNPIAAADELDADLHDGVLAEALAAAERDRVTGKAITPYLLDRFHRDTGGASLEANVAIVVANAALAAEVAVAWARTAGTGPVDRAD